jgi:hypothetical protein
MGKAFSRTATLQQCNTPTLQQREVHSGTDPTVYSEKKSPKIFVNRNRLFLPLQRQSGKLVKRQPYSRQWRAVPSQAASRILASGKPYPRQPKYTDRRSKSKKEKEATIRNCMWQDHYQ